KVPQCDLDWGIWDAGNVSVRALGRREADLCQCVCDLCESGLLRVTDWTRLDRG
ncbi:hypothetical protein KUCAC02_025662, partial [Chaenocephalus aceratus]